MPSQVVHQLNLEWQSHVDLDADEAQRWAGLCPALAACLTLDDVLASVAGAPDVILGFLLEQAHAGHALAGRTVLQTMLGKLVLMSGSGQARRQVHALDDLVGHMWIQISRYPLRSRPQRIAANLALDTLKAALRDWRTTDSSIEVSSAPDVVSGVLDEARPSRYRAFRPACGRTLGLLRSGHPFPLLASRPGARAARSDADGYGRLTSLARMVLLGVHARGPACVHAS
jgi:hypothetical protein